MFQLNYRDTRPIYEQIKDQFRRMIMTGGIAQGEKLPSVRELATQLAINPNTIQRAYRELEQEGWLTSVAGKGSFAALREESGENRKQELLAQFSTVAGELRCLGMTNAQLFEVLLGGDPT